MKTDVLNGLSTIWPICRSPSVSVRILPPLLPVASRIRTCLNPDSTSLCAAATPEIPQPTIRIRQSAFAMLISPLTQAPWTSTVWTLTDFFPRSHTNRHVPLNFTLFTPTSGRVWNNKPMSNATSLILNGKDSLISTETYFALYKNNRAPPLETLWNSKCILHRRKKIVQ